MQNIYNFKFSVRVLKKKEYNIQTLQLQWRVKQVGDTPMSRYLRAVLCPSLLFNSALPFQLFIEFHDSIKLVRMP